MSHRTVLGVVRSPCAALTAFVDEGQVKGRWRAPPKASKAVTAIPQAKLPPATRDIREPNFLSNPRPWRGSLDRCAPCVHSLPRPPVLGACIRAAERAAVRSNPGMSIPCSVCRGATVTGHFPSHFYSCDGYDFKGRGVLPRIRRPQNAPCCLVVSPSADLLSVTVRQLLGSTYRTQHGLLRAMKCVSCVLSLPLPVCSPV